MKTLSSPKAIAVLTGRGIDMMLAEGGSQAWMLDANNVDGCEYVVCVQNHKQKLFREDQLSAPHHTAFLVGRIAGCEPADPSSDVRGNRKKLIFSEYALINLPNAWPGNRNPVHYGTLEEMGIDDEMFKSLRFKAMPALAKNAKRPTFKKALSDLCAAYGHKPSDITITIRV